MCLAQELDDREWIEIESRDSSSVMKESINSASMCTMADMMLMGNGTERDLLGGKGLKGVSGRHKCALVEKNYLRWVG